MDQPEETIVSEPTPPSEPTPIPEPPIVPTQPTKPKVVQPPKTLIAGIGAALVVLTLGGIFVATRPHASPSSSQQSSRLQSLIKSPSQSTSEGPFSRLLSFLSVAPSLSSPTPTPIVTPSPAPSSIHTLATPTPTPTASPSPTPSPLAHATATPTPTPSPTPVPTASPSTGLPDGAENTTSFSPRVLFIGYNPSTDGKSLADTYFTGSSMGYTSSSAIESAVMNSTKDAFSRLSGGSIQFSIVNTVHITSFAPYPDGFTYSVDSYRKCVYTDPSYDASACEGRKWQFDYVKWIADNHICQLANDSGADEIWMLTPPYIMAWENFMIGPSPGFDVNGANYVTPGCNKHYVVVNGTYDRPTNVLHNIGHRIEATMRFLTENWRSEDRQNNWERFAATSLYNGSNPSGAYCGNAHFPSNTSSAYDYSNAQTKTSICSDWKNFPNFKGSQTSISCSTWGCVDPGWQEYWLGFIPHSSGKVQMSTSGGKPFYFLKDWWTYFLYPDNTLRAKSAM